MKVSWAVDISDEFEPEFDNLDEDVQSEILALARLIQQFGPQLGRPRVNIERLTPREYERTAVRRGGRRVESRACVRHEEESDPPGSRGQVRGQREAFLSRTDPQGR